MDGVLASVGPDEFAIAAAFPDSNGPGGVLRVATQKGCKIVWDRLRCECAHTSAAWVAPRHPEPGEQRRANQATELTRDLASALCPPSPAQQGHMAAQMTQRMALSKDVRGFEVGQGIVQFTLRQQCMTTGESRFKGSGQP